MKKQASGLIWTIILSVVSALYLYPIIMVLLNSFKKESAITTAGAFSAPTAETFAGFENYVSALTSQGFAKSLFYSLFMAEGMTKSQIASATKMHEYKCSIYMNALTGVEPRRIRAALDRCLETDRLMKSSSPGYMALERFICTIPAARK